MLSRIVLMFLLSLAPFAAAHTPVAQPELSEQEMALIEQMEQAMQEIRKIGGLYLVQVEMAPAQVKTAVFNLFVQAAKSPNCDDLFEMPEPHTIIFKGLEGKLEAQKLAQEFEKLGCKVELIELN